MTSCYILWATPHSLFAGKARAYLIKKGIPFKELLPSHPDFAGRVVPAVGHWVVPVVECPDGTILQDTTLIIEYFEQRHPQPAVIPNTGLQRFAAWLIGAYGSEALLPAAMHYRWSFRTEQEEFLRAEFGRAVHCGPDREARRAAGAQLMDYFSGMLPSLGVTPDSAALIEQSYLEMLDALDIHLQHYPYVMGGRPSIADVGLMAPLYAHLARDPIPANLMKCRAPNVFRWTERMNCPAIADGEFPDQEESYFADDAIPPTLEHILRLIFRDWSAELVATATQYNEWLKSHPDDPVGELVSKNKEAKVHPTLGDITFSFMGERICKASSPQSLWHFSRVLNQYASLEAEAAKRVNALLKNTDGEKMMAIQLAQPIVRKNYALIVGD